MIFVICNEDDNTFFAPNGGFFKDINDFSSDINKAKIFENKSVANYFRQSIMKSSNLKNIKVRKIDCDRNSNLLEYSMIKSQLDDLDLV